MRAAVAGALMCTCAALADDARPCSDIRFEPMSRLMLYGDTTRLGRPFAKDPTVIRHNGKYFMYYSECSYAKDRVPKNLPKHRTWWWGGIATSTNLVDWTRVGNIAVEGAPETVGWVAPCVKKFDGKIHIFAQGHDAKGIDAPKANSPKSLNVL